MNINKQNTNHVVLIAISVTLATVGYGLYATAFSSYTVNPNLDSEKTVCVNKVLSLAAVGVVRSVNDYDTAIVSCV
jgi:formate-dependent nitrite reductase membrane component NrfD